MNSVDISLCLISASLVVIAGIDLLRNRDEHAFILTEEPHSVRHDVVIAATEEEIPY